LRHGFGNRNGFIFISVVIIYEGLSIADDVVTASGFANASHFLGGISSIAKKVYIELDGGRDENLLLESRK
jgi:hypothetical protein